MDLISRSNGKTVASSATVSLSEQHLPSHKVSQTQLRYAARTQLWLVYNIAMIIYILLASRDQQPVCRSLHRHDRASTSLLVSAYTSRDPYGSLNMLRTVVVALFRYSLLLCEVKTQAVEK